jgi:NADH dehydrogenase I D subunit
MCILSKREAASIDSNLLTINFGPQHPAAHGVLRLLASLDGEVVRDVDAHIGLLHRGTEKLIESKTYLQAIPYFDRLDYVSMMAQEHTFSIALERLGGLTVSFENQFVRVIFLELTRILNHLLAITTHALDVGAITPFFWGFEERERIMEFYERVSGSRMHAAFIRPGGISQAIHLSLVNDIYSFCNAFILRLEEIHSVLTSNRIWCQRLINIGIVTAAEAKTLGFSGVMLRGSGVAWDLRVSIPYECYSMLNVTIPIGTKGDCYDRFLVRMNEMYASVSIIKQLIEENNKYQHQDKIGGNSPNINKNLMRRYMESVIYHFKSKTAGVYHSYLSNIYASTEAPKGEFGVFLSFDVSSQLYRCRIRAPGFFHLQALGNMAISHTLADLVTIIGTQDIVFGEVDR